MFRFLVTQSLRNRLIVLALAAVLVVYGAFSLSKLPVDVFPDLNRPTVTIMTEAEGYAPHAEERDELASFQLIESRRLLSFGASQRTGSQRPSHDLCSDRPTSSRSSLALWSRLRSLR